MESVDAVNVAFGRAIRSQRRARDLSQQRLAQRAGVNFKHLGEIERGNGNPRLTTIVQLVDALDLSVGEFVTLWRAAQREVEGAPR
jgi:transcriptional regulator with XRE-family HTH domain